MVNPRISNDVLVERIANLTSIIEEGFKGVHARQDKTNGHISEHDDRIRKVETANEINSQGKEYSWKKTTLITGAILTVVTVASNVLVRIFLN